LRHLPLAAVLGVVLSAGTASATSINLSSVSSDGTPASQLDATLDFSVSGSTLTLTLSNTGSDFNINQVFFGGSSAVTGLSLVSATHSANGDVTAAWIPVEAASAADGFGVFDFALTDGVGSGNPNIAHVGESIVFVLSISGTGSYADSDFIQPNASGYLAAAKFVNGPPDPECATAVIPTAQCPEGIGTEDSAFGGVPEPGTLALLALALPALALRLRRRA
jgi:hypothetical protein